LKSIIDKYSRKKAQNTQRVEFAYKNGKANSLLTQKTKANEAHNRLAKATWFILTRLNQTYTQKE
jgi:hypothetical protein